MTEDYEYWVHCPDPECSGILEELVQEDVEKVKKFVQVRMPCRVIACSECGFYTALVFIKAARDWFGPKFLKAWLEVDINEDGATVRL